MGQSCIQSSSLHACWSCIWSLVVLFCHRMTVRWKNACINHTGCSQGSFNCNQSSGDYKFLNDFFSTKTQNTVAFDFEMFDDALQSGIVEVTDFPQKFLHCFQWGLQNLSCFDQNLQKSTFIWENFFAVWITISGLVLFLFLIGNMQTYLQSKTIRSEEMRLKGREIEYIWQETNGVDVDNLPNNLPKDLRMNIKRELCLELLKKVEEFKKLNETTLDALCDCVKPAFYIERTHIIREGDPIEEMLFIVHGKLWTYTSKAKTTASASASESTEHCKENKNKNCKIKDHLKDGDFCGEEFIAWALDEPSSSNLPMSTRTIQALTKVEAFALVADDLKNVFIKYHLSSSCELNLNHPMIQAARVIQDAWRRHHTSTNS
ncbi:cyclic nucleotide-gated ion channel 1-like [Pistacia vera]|uniref:cyclic nucleotide-gated ion channel 1-like n=1 Tax=Pistacia vera TaxID=55513 RepID=UPI00126381FF|nr:cyclic nucleotide-gated ion channel 1-like [Pistacia vera]